ncbi:MAG TPA: beta-ketoacyl synthase N-terminal-like domain-containing protein [Pseudomonadota bacterium]|jgi:hypothetical protein|nr:beta-ketoacyl synthase N-terminal-like domain-containing protein [Pseudomonadota bacterium]
MIAVRAAARLRVNKNEPLLPVAPQAAQAELKPLLLRMDRLCGLSVVVVEKLLAEHSSLRQDFSVADVGIVVGTAYGCHKTDEEYYVSYLQGQPSPRLFAYTLPSAPSGELAIRHRLRGAGFTLSLGRTSGMNAVAEAARLLSSGHVSACLVVAVEVADPAFAQEEVGDAAVALWLSKIDDQPTDGSPQIVTTMEVFVDGAPAKAVEQVLARTKPSPGVWCCDETTWALSKEAWILRQFSTVNAPGGAASGLWCLCEQHQEAAESRGYLCADSTGYAALVVLSPGRLQVT